MTLLVLRESAVLLGLGLCAGLLLSWLGANTIRAFLFRTQPLDRSRVSQRVPVSGAAAVEEPPLSRGRNRGFSARK